MNLPRRYAGAETRRRGRAGPSRAARATTSVAPTVSPPTQDVRGANRRGRACPVPRQGAAPLGRRQASPLRRSRRRGTCVEPTVGDGLVPSRAKVRRTRLGRRQASPLRCPRRRGTCVEPTVGDGLVPSREDPLPARATTSVAPTVFPPTRDVRGANRRGRACPVPRRPVAGSGDDKRRPYGVPADVGRAWSQPWGTGLSRPAKTRCRLGRRQASPLRCPHRRGTCVEPTVGDGLVPSREDPLPARATTSVAPTVFPPTWEVRGAHRRGRACPVPRRPVAGSGDDKRRPYGVPADAGRAWSPP